MAVLKLSLLGEFELQGTFGPRLPTRKSEALLAYLALPAGQTHRRDKLAGLLWGDKDERKARHNLSQALHTIRAALKFDGGDPLIADSGTVALNPESVEIDVAAFERLATRQTLEALSEAAELYRGDPLGGIAIGETAFEDWLRGEQGRLRTVGLNALDALLCHHMDIGDDVAAIETARRLLSFDPTHEAVHRKLMGLYQRTGRQDAAIHQFQICVETLRRELDIAPDDETRARYDGILRQRANPPLSTGMSGQKLTGKPSIAVLPFDNMSGYPGQEYFSDGIAEDIITALSRFHQFFVIARNSSFRYKGNAINVKRVALELGVQYVVEGSMRRAGNRVRVSAQLIDATIGNHIWAERYDREVDDIFAVQDEITEHIAMAIAPELELAEMVRVRHKNVRVLGDWELLACANWHASKTNEVDHGEAQSLLSKAIALNPYNARTYATLALTYNGDALHGWRRPITESRIRALEYSQKALDLDKEDELAHAALGISLYMSKRHDAGAERLRTAVRLNPNYSLALGQLGIVLVYAHKHEEALELLGKAAQLSPKDRLLPHYVFHIAMHHFIEERYDHALAWVEKALHENPNFPIAFRLLAAVQGLKGNRVEARTAHERLVQLMPNVTIASTLEAVPFAYQEDAERYAEGLRRAGMVQD